jgi:glyoxylase-like metal-dependent hydrolase (beta-lactamase superfamily II)
VIATGSTDREDGEMERATPDTWYRTLPQGDGVTLIDEPGIKGFFRGNIWHVRGRDRDLLVDSGMGAVSLREQVKLVNERPVLAVAGHTHFDHIGCHHEFETRLVHPAEAEILARPTRANTLAEGYVDESIFTRLPPGNFDPQSYSVEPAPAQELIEDGDEIDLGDRRFRVIHTPGHSPGGLALFEEATGILISGDIVYDGPLVEDTFHSDAEDYVRSMERLLELDVTVVHGGHFESYGAERHREILTGWLAGKASD